MNFKVFDIGGSFIKIYDSNSKEIIRIYIKLNDTSKSFLDKNDFNWFLKNPVNENIDYFKASKKYSQERNLEIFKLIEMGSVISKGDLFNAIIQLIQ